MLSMSGMLPSKTISLSIGGSLFRISRARLLLYPHSRLGQLIQASDPSLLCDEVLFDAQGLPVYFFDRRPEAFSTILSLYRDNVIHQVQEHLCPDSFTNELKYWQIENQKICQYCAKRNSAADLSPVGEGKSSYCNMSECSLLTGKLQSQQTLLTQLSESFSEVSVPGDEWCPMTTKGADEIKVSDVSVEGDEQERKEIRAVSCYERLKQRTNTFVDDPTSSKFATVFMVISVGFVLLTVFALILGSIPHFQEMDPQTNSSQVIWEIEMTDNACVIYFTLEYLLRLWAAPCRMEYIKSPLSIIDVLAVFPFYIELLFAQAGLNNASLSSFKRTMVVMRILRVLRVLRVLRILKVARYSSGFQSLGGTLAKSWRELLMMCMFMVTTNILCLITMTTVGYGDICPTTVAGKIIACVASISGIILLAFPISVVVDNFNEMNAGKKSNSGSPEGTSQGSLSTQSVSKEAYKVVHGRYTSAKMFS